MPHFRLTLLNWRLSPVRTEILPRSFCLEKGRGGKGKGPGEEVGAGKGRQERENGFTSPTSPFHCPLRFVTSHLRFALAPIRNRKLLRRRQTVDSYDFNHNYPSCQVDCSLLGSRAPGTPFPSPFKLLPRRLSRLWRPRNYFRSKKSFLIV